MVQRDTTTQMIIWKWYQWGPCWYCVYIAMYDPCKSRNFKAIITILGFECITYIYVYIYLYMKWTAVVKFATKSAQHAHARMIATVIERVQLKSCLRPSYRGCFEIPKNVKWLPPCSKGSTQLFCAISRYSTAWWLVYQYIHKEQYIYIYIYIYVCVCVWRDIFNR